MTAIIASTVHLTATAGAGYDKAITTNGGGKVTIGGVEYDGGAPSPSGTHNGEKGECCILDGLFD